MVEFIKMFSKEMESTINSVPNFMANKRIEWAEENKLDKFRSKSKAGVMSRYEKATEDKVAADKI